MGDTLTASWICPPRSGIDPARLVGAIKLVGENAESENAVDVGESVAQ